MKKNYKEKVNPQVFLVNPITHKKRVKKRVQILKKNNNQVLNNHPFQNS